MPEAAALGLGVPLIWDKSRFHMPEAAVLGLGVPQIWDKLRFHMPWGRLQRWLGMAEKE